MRLNDARDNILDALAAAGAGVDDLRAVVNDFRAARDQRAEDADFVKCPRCWNYHTVRLNFGHTPEEVAADSALANEKLCDDCQDLILTKFPHHPSVPYIEAALAAQRVRFRSNPNQP